MLVGPVRAQSTLTPDEYNALVAAVESTPSQPASAAPNFGNFYTITHGESWPPLPSDTLGLSFWPLGGNVFLLDDRGFGYGASRADSSFEPPPSLTNVGSGGSGGNPYFTPQVYTSSELWLQITNLVGSNATLIIHPPSTVTEGVYDVLTATNLTQPIDWQWLLRTDPGQTNLPVSIGTNAGTFYALGKPNDFVANDSLGTNFWLTFPDMETSASNTLSLYISSPVAASGTVIIPGESNGPTVVIANSPDSDVNGTYVLTNMYVNPRDYYGYSVDENPEGLTGQPVTNVYVMGSNVIFFDESGFDQMGWVLVTTNNPVALYAGFFGVSDINEVIWNDVPNSYPTTMISSCTESTLVEPFAVSAGGVTQVSIPNSTMMVGNDAIGTNNGINVTASSPVSVYAFEYNEQLSVTFTAYPASLLGTNYCLLARPAFGATGFSEFAIMAVETNTTVQMTASSSADLNFSGGGNPFPLTLQPGQVYQVQSSNNRTDDVTGTLVWSDKPIAVFAGAGDANVPNSTTQADNPLIQEQIPVEDWGTNVLALSFAARTGGDSYRVVPAQNGTVIFTNGTAAATNDAGVPFDSIIDGSIQFTATKPIQVAHFANGTTFDHAEGDPCEVFLPPASHYLETNVVVTFGTSAGDFDENYLNIIVPQSVTNSTKLDGTIVPTTNFVPILESGYYGARLPVGSSYGIHSITASQPIGVIIYGWGGLDAYGYLGGTVK